MSDLPATAGVGIETVEWSVETAGNLTVQITGRWRRRGPNTTGQPTLVIEAEGQRHRYPAMPEPPRLAGTAPGVWRLSFTVPDWLAPDLGRTWLQFGTVIVPLPPAVPAPGERRRAHLEEVVAEVRASADGDSSPPAAPPSLVPPAPGPAAEESGGVAELASRVTALERELHEARVGREELVASLAEGDRSRRIAEQRAHAEQALRQDLARQLSTSAQAAERARQAMGDLAAAEDRIRALEQALQEARRRSDEAEQVAATATAARERAERERERAERELSHSSEAVLAENARLRFEHELRDRRAGATAWIPAEPPAASRRPVEPATEAGPPPAKLGAPPAAELGPPPAAEPHRPREAGLQLPPGPEHQPSPRAGVVDTLRRELDARARADVALRVRLIDAEARLAARVLLEQRTTGALTQLRGELETLRDAVARERALRADAERHTAELERDLGAERSDAQRRIEELERELSALRAEAERRAGELRLQLSALRDAADRSTADLEHELSSLRGERVRREDAERRVAELERRLSGQRALSQDAYDAIGELRGALERLATPAPGPPEPAPAPPAPAPLAPASPVPAPPAAEAADLVPAAPPALEAPDLVPAAPAALESADPAPAPVVASPAPAAGVVEPARLNDALTRLRETIAPQEAPGASVASAGARPPTLHEALGRPSLERAFRKLVRSDGDAAGRLLLELLPLQRVVYPHPIAYDLILGKGRGPARHCVCVTVPNGTVTIGVQSTPRPRDEVDFQVIGDPARIARLLVAGRVRRRLGWGVARVRGRREGIAALSALLGTPLDLRALHYAGIRFDPATAFALVASMIEPGWTVRERFTLAHTEPEAATTYVIVRDGRPIRVSRTAPEGRVTTTLHCRADQLLAALAGEPVDGLTVHGDDAPLASLRQWIKLAQSE